MMALATTPGTFTQSASVSETEYNLDLPAASASTSAQVVESPGMVEFGAGEYEVTDQSGVAVIPVVRLYGSLGTVTVTLSNGRRQRDPRPRLHAHLGHADPRARPDLGLDPGPGARRSLPGSGPVPQRHARQPHGWGTSSVRRPPPLLHIQDVDPDVTAPVVSGLTWSGTSRAITSLTLSFSAPLDPSYATDPADYRLFKVTGGQSIPIASITYDAANFSVTIVPQSPTPLRPVRRDPGRRHRVRRDSATSPATSSMGPITGSRDRTTRPCSPRATG